MNWDKPLGLTNQACTQTLHHCVILRPGTMLVKVGDLPVCLLFFGTGPVGKWIDSTIPNFQGRVELHLSDTRLLRLLFKAGAGGHGHRQSHCRDIVLRRRTRKRCARCIRLACLSICQCSGGTTCKFNAADLPFGDGLCSPFLINLGWMFIVYYWVHLGSLH
jgi:hypothetical protein